MTMPEPYEARTKAENDYFSYQDEPDAKERFFFVNSYDGFNKKYTETKLFQNFSKVAALSHEGEYTLLGADDNYLIEFITKYFDKKVFKGSITIYDLNDEDDFEELAENFGGKL